jgi:hypothetical protein
LHKNRKLLNKSYIIYILWGILLLMQYLSGGVLMILFFPFLLLYLAFIPLSFIYSIYLLKKSKKWLSEERIAAILFLLPMLFIVMQPYIQKEIRIHTTVPTDSLVKSFIENKNAGRPTIFDMSVPIIKYHDDDKVMELYIRIIPEKYIDYYENPHNEFALERNNIANPFMNRLSLKYIDLPSEIGEVTKVPKTIIVYGYWGENLILKAYFKRGWSGYKVTEPYPNLSLVGSKEKWYFIYNVNGYQERLFVKEVQGADFKVDLSLK